MINVKGNPRFKSWEYFLLRAARDISLPPGLYETIEKRYAVLEGILAAGTDPLLQRVHVFPQGSIRLRTTIKPAPGSTGELATVDADAVIWIEGIDHASAAGVLTAVTDRFQEGVRVEAPIDPLRRGIRIIYGDENPGFHIDITPARNLLGNRSELGHGALQVPDRELGWKASSPIAYSDWLDDASKKSLPIFTMDEALAKSLRVAMEAEASQEDMPSYNDYADANVLRAAIKLLKRHRDMWAIRNRNTGYRPISAVITTLAAKAYEELAKDSAIYIRDPAEIMLELIEKMPSFIRPRSGSWQVCNPMDEGENFAEKWNRPHGEGDKYRNAFHTWHAEAKQAFALGLEDLGSSARFQEEVAKAFGTGRTLVEKVVSGLPADWTLPGLHKGTSRSVVSLAGLSGSAVASGESQSNVGTVDRLG